MGHVGDRAVRTLLLQWWKQRDDYQWRIDFLRTRGLLKILRWLIAGIGATMGVLAVLNVFLTPGVDEPITRIGWAVVGVGSLAWAARWALLPWPTARVSAAMVIYVDILMTLSAVMFGDPNLAMSGISILLCAGGYVVFFHGPRLHLVHIAWCVVSVVCIAVWLASTMPDHGVQVAVSRTVIALLVTVCILPALQFGFWLLQGSSQQALTDPLTELTNRRGLSVSVKRLAHSAPEDTKLCALLIDVDGFKQVNDTLGHAVGDDVLIRTAQRIKESVPRDAVVVRWGGDEFLVVDRIRDGQAEAVAEKIRAAVAAPAQPPIACSIGLATCARADADLIDVIGAADTAMYEAKASGGNRVVATRAAA